MIKKSVLSMSYNSENNSKDSIFKIGNSYNSDVTNLNNINIYFSDKNKNNTNNIEELLDNSMSKGYKTNRLIKNKKISKNFSSSTLNNCKSSSFYKLYNKSNCKNETKSEKNINIKINKKLNLKYNTNRNNCKSAKEPQLHQIDKGIDNSPKCNREKKMLCESKSFKQYKNVNKTKIYTSDLNFLSQHNVSMDNKRVEKISFSNSSNMGQSNNKNIEKKILSNKDVNKYKIDTNKKMKLLYDNNNNTNAKTNNRSQNNKNIFSKIANDKNRYKLKKSVSNKKHKKNSKEKAVKLYSSPRHFSPSYYNNINSKLIANKIKKINGFNKSNKKAIKNSHNFKHTLYEPKNFNKITVNLNPKNTMLKNKIEINSYMKIDTSISPSTSPITNTPENKQLFFTKKPINCKNIASTPKTIFKLMNKSNSRDSFPYNNKYNSNSVFNNNNNINEKNYINNLITSESTEINNIVNIMNNKLQQFKANNSFYSSSKKNINDTPEGPEDIHYRFVELYKQNKLFYNNLKSKFADKVSDNNDKNNNIDIIDNDNYYFGKEEFEEYFENYEDNDNVPYI